MATALISGLLFALIAEANVPTRIEARRDDAMITATVTLVADGKVIDSFPANARHDVVPGRYEIEVRAGDASARATKTIAGAKLNAIAFDLSDAAVVGTATLNGKPARAIVRAFAGDRLITSADAGAKLTLPPGPYTIVTEASDLADFATRRRNVYLIAKKTEKILERFDAGTLTIAVVHDGLPAPATVRFARPSAGDFFASIAAPGTITVTPGSYEVSLESPLYNLGPQSLEVARAKERKQTFDLTEAKLTVTVVDGARPVDADVHLRIAGGGAEVATKAANGAFLVWPGRYELTVRLADGEEIIDGPFETKLAERIKRSIPIERALLTVRAMRGENVVSEAEIFVFRPGANKPSAHGLSGASLSLRPGTYDVKVALGDATVWKEGVRVKRANVLRIDLPKDKAKDEPLPDGDLPPPAESLPDGDG